MVVGREEAGILCQGAQGNIPVTFCILRVVEIAWVCAFAEKFLEWLRSVYFTAYEFYAKKEKENYK